MDGAELLSEWKAQQKLHKITVILGILLIVLFVGIGLRPIVLPLNPPLPKIRIHVNCLDFIF